MFVEFEEVVGGGSSRHSDLTADLPRRENRRKPRLCLIWAKTGSTMALAFEVQLGAGVGREDPAGVVVEAAATARPRAFAFVGVGGDQGLDVRAR